MIRSDEGKVNVNCETKEQLLNEFRLITEEVKQVLEENGLVGEGCRRSIRQAVELAIQNKER